MYRVRIGPRRETEVGRSYARSRYCPCCRSEERARRRGSGTTEDRR